MEQIFARTNRHAFHPNKLPIKGYGVAAIGNQRGDTARFHVIKRVRLKTARNQTNEMASLPQAPNCLKGAIRNGLRQRRRKGAVVIEENISYA
ncbi:MAG: hypothetical protein V8T51_01685 [Senegalimassilia faecalis]